MMKTKWKRESACFALFISWFAAQRHRVGLAKVSVHERDLINKVSSDVGPMITEGKVFNPYAVRINNEPRRMPIRCCLLKFDELIK